MHATVLVWCRDCGGEDRAPVCGWCMGQKHEAVNRTSDGGVPEPYREWLPPLLPEVPRGCSR